MIEIILAEDHQVVREALRLLLETQPDFHVAAETGEGWNALQLVKENRPDVLILDWMLPGLSGPDVARRVTRLSPETNTIILSMYDTESYVVEALQAGAAGYVLKKSSSNDLILAIRHALAGARYLSPDLDTQAIQAYLEEAQDNPVTDTFETLTPREREIFFLAADGLSTSQIADRLSLSVRTVEMHRSHLMKKLHLRSQTELVKYALKRGLI